MSNRGFNVIGRVAWGDIRPRLGASSHRWGKLHDIDDHDVLVEKIYPMRRGSKTQINEARQQRGKDSVDVDKFPESTVHWLVDPSLVVMCSKLESRGYLKDVEKWVSDDRERVASWSASNQLYADERWEMLTESDKQLLERVQWADRFRVTGVGGIRWYEGRIKVKCLHLHLSHYIAQLGQMPPQLQGDQKWPHKPELGQLNIVGAKVAKEIGLA